MKSKVDKVDVDKLPPATVGLSKLSDVVKSDVVKRDVYNAKIKNIIDTTEALDHRKKKFSIMFTKANTKLCLSLHYDCDNIYLFLIRK